MEIPGFVPDSTARHRRALVVLGLSYFQNGRRTPNQFPRAVPTPMAEGDISILRRGCANAVKFVLWVLADGVDNVPAKPAIRPISTSADYFSLKRIGAPAAANNDRAG
jgi:hypothetical protein